MKELDKQKFYRQLHSILIDEFGHTGERIWQQAADDFDRIMKDEHYKNHKGAFAIPAVVLYRALRSFGKDADGIMQKYGGLKKLGFTRTQTLGTGGTCCDFHFFRK